MFARIWPGGLPGRMVEEAIRRSRDDWDAEKEKHVGYFIMTAKKALAWWREQRPGLSEANEPRLFQAPWSSCTNPHAPAGAEMSVRSVERCRYTRRRSARSGAEAVIPPPRPAFSMPSMTRSARLLQLTTSSLG